MCLMEWDIKDQPDGERVIKENGLNDIVQEHLFVHSNRVVQKGCRLIGSWLSNTEGSDLGNTANESE